MRQTCRSIEEGKRNYRFWLIIPTVTNWLPSRSATLKVPECLRELKRLNDNPLLLLVVPNLSVTGKREVLSQRVSVEAVIRHDSPEVRMPSEEHTKQVIDLTLEPHGTVIQASNARDGRGFIRVRLNPYSRVVAYAEQVVDNLKAVLTGGEVDSRDVGDLLVLGGGVVAEESKNGDDSRRGDVDNQFVLPDRELLNVLGQAGHEVLAVLVEGFALLEVLVGGIDHGSVERLHCYTVVSISVLSSPCGHQLTALTRSLGLARVGNLVHGLRFLESTPARKWPHTDHGSRWSSQGAAGSQAHDRPRRRHGNCASIGYEYRLLADELRLL